MSSARLAATATVAALVVQALLLAAAAAPLAAGSTRASLPAIERQVMCVTCKIPLIVAQSPQADRERAYIQSLIAAGQDEAQIKRALVAQYGRSVLGLPSASGVGVLAYAVPIAAVAMLVALLVLLLPRWRARQRAQSQAAQPAPRPALSSEDEARLEADMARFD